MNRPKIFLGNWVIILAVLACGINNDVLRIAGPQSSQTPASPGLEEESQLTTIPLPTTQPTEQPSPYSQIESLLRSKPPCTGNQEVRKEAILALDEYLKNNLSTIDPDIEELYINMMGYVKSEISEPVLTGVRIWSMYNHGFIVKTPSTIFAFDLIGGIQQWDYQIPDSILDQIQVLFVSHRHDDHRDLSVMSAIKGFGGEVVMPLEDKPGDFGTVYLAPDQELIVGGLQVKTYDGLHGGMPVRIYHVTTPEGWTIMHTGDNQTSDTLPDGVTVDILLLNAWVNESGSVSAVDGMRNSIKKLTPSLTIPGHIQELGHRYDPSDVKGRVPFEWPLAVADVPLPGEVSVQIWGEHCDFPTK